MGRKAKFTMEEYDRQMEEIRNPMPAPAKLNLGNLRQFAQIRKDVKKRREAVLRGIKPTLGIK